MSDYDKWRGSFSSSSGNTHTGMRGLRGLAGSAASRAKDYVQSKEYKSTYDQISTRVSGSVDKLSTRLSQTNIHDQGQDGGGGERGEQTGLRSWAARQIQSRKTSSGGVNVGIEKVHVFPGWAVRRYQRGDVAKQGSPFDIDIFVAGYASSMKPPELVTRSQKVFIQLAKRYAALPKLPAEPEIGQFTSNQNYNAQPKLTKSTEDLMKHYHLPPTPSEMTDDKEIAALEAQFQKAEADVDDNDDISMHSTGDSPPGTPGIPAAGVKALTTDELRKLHNNLNSRLEPFWSSVLGNRTVRLSVFATQPPLRAKTEGQAKKEDLLIDFGDGGEHGAHDEAENYPLHVAEVQTSAQGDFQKSLRIPWESICTHPKAVYIAFGDQQSTEECKIYVRAELVPQEPNASAGMATQSSVSTVSVTNQQPQGVSPDSVIVETSASVRLTQARLRVVSDIDDTVKTSEILSGAKKVFHNVFVSELNKLVIPEMSDWYQRMWHRGVRFHYVSNSPFELLPVISEFIHVSDLPDGSVKLRSYNGRSLFNGLVSSPSARKRSNVMEVLNNFLECQFILIGDTGEQDLELYASLAKERPQQILAVFVRDVSTIGERLTDPTGAHWQQGSNNDVLQLYSNPNQNQSNMSFSSTHSSSQAPTTAQPYKSYVSRRTSSLSSNKAFEPPQSQSAYDDPNGPSNEPAPPAYSRHSTSQSQYDSSGVISEEPTPIPLQRASTQPLPGAHPHMQNCTESQLQALPLPTRRRVELQMRVNKARDEIPVHIPLRIFKDPVECVESDEMLHRVGL